MTLRSDLAQLTAIAREHMSIWLGTVSGPEAAAEGMAIQIAPYAESAALLAADWYLDQNPDSKYDPEPVALITDERAENTAKWLFAGPQTPDSRMRAATQSMIYDAARNTVLVNANAEGVAIVRHAHANAHNDCIARATVDPRASTANSDDVPRDFRHNCECLYIPVRKGVYEPPDYTSEWRERIAEARRAGNTSPEAVANWLDAH